jgi:ABC-type transport system involved in multi-copper enzyme maturation permease subunit
MTFLPIVDRELREGSRRRGTYWLRVRVAFLALLIGLAAYVINLLEPPVQLGSVLFWGLSGASMLFCLLAGRRSTADCISQEKREGTLGLLFLTDLKGYDVVLGKMVATSISGFYALVSVFPVLAIPLLAGGMTNGEFWRMVLLLVNTFFFSLAVGIFASAVSREYRAAMALNFLLGLFIMGAPVACAVWFLATRNLFVPELFYSCPIFSFARCEDTRFATSPSDFWWSLGVTQALAWMLTFLACRIVPRTWGDKPPPAPSRRWRWRNLGRFLNFGNPARGIAFRKRALDVNAFYWLAARARLKPLHVWIFLGGAVAWWIAGWWKSGNYWMAEETFFTTGFIVNAALKLWIALEAGQRLGEDRRGGSFELLLATPLTAGDFLRGQMLALRRQFLRPLLLVTAAELFVAIMLKRRGTLNTQELYTSLASVAMLWADVVALPWVAMAAALTFKSQTQATSFTVARVFILPWVLFGCAITALGILANLDLIRWHPSDRFVLGAWFGIGLALDLLFGLRGWRTLRKNFRTLAVQSFLPEPPQPPWWSKCWHFVKWTARLAARSLPPRARRPALACLISLLTVGAVVLFRRSQQHFPPPVLVSITQSNAPFNVFPGGGSGVFFIMPDGTLWQWGKPGAPQSPRAQVPEQIGTAHDWIKVVGAGTHCLGLRADGTIWGWGFCNGGYIAEPQPAVLGNDWIDLGTGTHHAAALKRDGTLWIWNEPLVANDRRATPILAFQVAAEYFPWVMSPSNWISVYCGPESTFALNKDGTLWAQGRFAANTISSYPTLVCTETNWIALSADGLARNQAGQLWDIRNAVPNPQADAASVCFLVNSNWLSDHEHCIIESGRAQIRGDGTLWSALPRSGSTSTPAAEAWRQLGARSDWVSVWGAGFTAFGLTADGMVWTWGAELGQEPPKTYETRLELLRTRLTGFRQPAASKSPALLVTEPRPLLKLVGANASQQKK